MTYRLTQGTTIFRTTDGAFIPPDPANTDYVAYLAWLEKGNIPEPAPEPIAPHAPEPLPALTPAEKLASIGLSVEELRQLLTE
jgi:hypothetical protein